MAGLGTAGRPFIPAFLAHPGMRLVAAAEPDTSVRDAFAAEHGLATYPGLREMLDHPGLNAVYIATPTPLHSTHVHAAFAAGKHVIVEKPMARDLAEAQAMVAAAAEADRILVVGHSHSFDWPVNRMRAMIAGGSLGRVQMIHSWNFSDWIYRPRRADELDDAQGGGVTFRQGSHQFDIIRLLGGGLLRSVRAHAYDWDPARPATGAHSVFLEFMDGATATAVYNGYGGLPGSELCGGVTEWGFPEPVGSRPPVRRVPENDEAQGKRQRARAAGRADPPFQPHFGLTVVSGERGDMRQSPEGLVLYTAAGRQAIDLRPAPTPHALVVAEFHDAVIGRTPPLHDGRWGLANLEVCWAALESSRTGQAVTLQHQVAA